MKISYYKETPAEEDFRVRYAVICEHKTWGLFSNNIDAQVFKLNIEIDINNSSHCKVVAVEEVL